MSFILLLFTSIYSQTHPVPLHLEMVLTANCYNVSVYLRTFNTGLYQMLNMMHNYVFVSVSSLENKNCCVFITLD